MRAFGIVHEGRPRGLNCLEAQLHSEFSPPSLSSATTTTHVPSVHYPSLRDIPHDLLSPYAMNISVAPALLLGLGARVALDLFTHTGEPTISSQIMLGCWQGVALWYASKKHDVGLPVACGIGAKVFLEFMFLQDIFRLGLAVICTFVGAVATDVLSSAIDEQTQDKRFSSSKKHSNSNPTTSRPTHNSSRKSSSRPQPVTRDDNTSRRSRNTASDITSIESSSFGSRSSSMSPFERDIAALRTRASLADTERRRFKEERKWAKSQGNLDLAEQLKWQIQKYTALMKSFHHEADTKVVEGMHLIYGTDLNLILTCIGQPLE